MGSMLISTYIHQNTKGSTTSLQNPALQIHEFDVDDDVFYRLAVVMVHTTKFSEHRRIILLLPINGEFSKASAL